MADTAWCHEEPQREPLRIGHGVKVGVQHALWSPLEATMLVIGSPNFVRSFVGARRAFR